MQGLTKQTADCLTLKDELCVEALAGTAAVAPCLESLITCILGLPLSSLRKTQFGYYSIQVKEQTAN